MKWGRLLSSIVPCIAALCIGWSPAGYTAEGKYPVRPLRFLIPFPAGGAADTIARTIAEPLSAQLGQSIVIDNRPGAGGRLATEMLAKAEPDGYTLLVGTLGAISISPALYKNLPYNMDRDFLPITRVGEILNVMVVNPSTGAKSVKDFIDWAKKRNGNVRFGSSGAGQPDHLAGVFFERLAGIDMVHVPYKGGGPALVDLISGDIQVMFSTYVVALPHVKSGRLRVLAVTTAKRQPLLPDLPAVAETVPGFDISNWNGMFVPAKTPRAIADHLFVEINKAIKNAEVKKRQNAAGIEPVGSASRAEFVKFLRDDSARWAKIVKDANIKVE